MQQDDFDMDGDFTHAVMVAVVLQAVKDAQHGSRGARRWLVTAGRRWTDELVLQRNVAAMSHGFSFRDAL